MAEHEILQSTRDQVQSSGKRVSRDQLEKVMKKTRKQVYKRPMTAVNTYKQRQNQNESQEDSFFEDEQDIQRRKLEAEIQQRIKREDEAEVIVKEKLTVENAIRFNRVRYFIQGSLEFSLMLFRMILRKRKCDRRVKLLQGGLLCQLGLSNGNDIITNRMMQK